MDDDAGRYDEKTILKRYLQRAREALLWKVEGLPEREARLPRTPTGTNLLGIVKHAATIEIGYFGDTFGRAWPTPEEIPWYDSLEEDPQADWYATKDQSIEQITGLYRRVWAFADATIDELPLDARGHVPWWGENGDVSLFWIILHVTADLTQHAGHADILRELADGSAGLRADASNLPGWDEEERLAYLGKLQGIAEAFPGR
ncbi:DinB family protein [Antribacter sp. KLBMP9083]|uniref:DinB family protein n=1 Tax=Antribacter soli TaxID=2910976 RepID=A0AA41QBQ1_9MICO|nr:DinB family protein [Antribacter soli]MCF4120513.1 DinB family protein [Antribacter soli]